MYETLSTVHLGFDEQAFETLNIEEVFFLSSSSSSSSFDFALGSFERETSKFVCVARFTKSILY